MKLAIVVPCFNEEEMLPLSAPRLAGCLHSMIEEGLVDDDSFVLYVNDGSSDSTWSIITGLYERDPRHVHGLDLVTNSGHQNAILAGMEAAVEIPECADAVVTIDADLQDPLECIPEMVRRCMEGADVVYGVRSSRESDSFMKRVTAESFYHLQGMMGLKTIYNHADFRLMTARAVRELGRYTERNMYLRGVIPMMGFPSAIVEETRMPREAGKTKYTLGKMLGLALDGITSFSIKPVYMILGLGVLFVLVAICIGIYVLVSLLTGSAVHGWSSLILSIWLVGGFVLISVGIVGMYVGKAYIESKRRPRYNAGTHLR